MGSPRRTPTRARARLALAVGSLLLGLAAACTHAETPVVQDPFVIPPPVMRAEPFAAPRDAGACSPGDVSGFRPAWKPPGTFYQNVCTTAQTGLVAGCIASGATAACKTFFADPINATCIGCAYTDTSGTKLGAVVMYKGALIDVNYADCFANADGDLTVDGCGAQIQARRFCTLAACAGCSTTRSSEVVTAENCALQAEDTVCKQYTDSSVCEYDLINGPGAVCRIPARGGLEAAANKYIGLFCGKNPLADAGPG